MLRNRSRRTRIGSRRAIARSRSTSAVATALGDLALDRAPEQVEHLRDHDHAGDAVVAQRIEDDPRVPAAHVQDVGADIAARSTAPTACSSRCDSGSSDTIRCSIGGTIRWNDSIEATTLSWVSITPLGVPVVPLVNTSSKTSSADGRFHDAWRASQSGGKAGSSSAGSAARASTVVVGKSASPASRGIRGVAPGPEDEVARTRCPDDRLDRLGRHPQVEWDEHQPRVHRAEVGRGQLGRRRAPGQDPITRLKVERTQTPRRDARSAVELAVRPRGRRPIVVAHAEGRPLGVAGRRRRRAGRGAFETRSKASDSVAGRRIVRRAMATIVSAARARRSPSG